MLSVNSKSFSSPPLPSYKNPPVNEVVCGVRFRYSDKLLVPHFGSLWDRFKNEYPNIQHAHPISAESGEILVDQATGLPIPRVWFINKPGDQLIQFQIDRFYYNWRRRENDYPRYHHVIKNFKYVMKTIEDFFKTYGFGELELRERELSYINHIPIDKDADISDYIPRIFKDFIWDASEHQFLPKPKKISWQTQFQLPNSKGVMIVSLRQAIKTEDKKHIIVFELKAFGPNDSGDSGNSTEWFDMAREWIVRGFTEMTTDEIQKSWGREKND